MATINGYTTAYIDAVLNGTIASAAVVGDDLILTKVDATTANAGNVRGATGATGPQGFNIVAHAEATVDFVWGLLADTFTDFTDLDVTFDATPGRSYQLIASAILRSVETDGAFFDLELMESGGVYARGSVDSGVADRGAGVTANRILEAPPGWSGSTTISTRVRADTAELCTADNTYSPAFLSVIDLGILA